MTQKKSTRPTGAVRRVGRAQPDEPARAPTSEALDPPRVVRTAAQPAAVIRLKVPRSEMRTVMPAAIGEVMSAIAAQGVAPAGPLFDRHFRMDPDTFDFEVGVPVKSPVSRSGRVRPGELPAARVARTVYRGPYEGLGAAWGAFDAWIAAAGHTPAAGLWQRYVAGPESSPDPAKWRTELNRPLASASGARRTKTKRKSPAASGGDAAAQADERLDPEVTALLRRSKHPMTAEIEAVRRILLGASPEIREGVKWNAPSFRTADYFATLNNLGSPRARDSVQLILHAGARRKDVKARGKVADPSGLLKWLGDDRGLVTFADAREVEAKRGALQALVRAWIRLL